jgi:hypothetical protein
MQMAQVATATTYRLMPDTANDKFRSKMEQKNRWERTLAEGERRNVDDERRVENLQGGVRF